MRIIQSRFSTATGWQHLRDDQPGDIQLVISFGNFELMQDPCLYNQLREKYPEANILMNSCETEITGTGPAVNSISVTAIGFEETKIRTAVTHASVVKNSYEAGYFLARALDPEGLRNVLVIAGGPGINGSELVDSLSSQLPAKVLITGGLAGHQGLISDSLIGLNNAPDAGTMVAIGFYGNGLSIHSASMSGWEGFGPERVITKAHGHILYELNHEPAMDFYRMYLGRDMNPGAGLLFPMSICMPDTDEWILRTVVAFNESDGSIAFAGKMPEEARARFMKTTTDNLIHAASEAARHTVRNLLNKPELALLISGIGRKLVLENRVNEEVAAIRSIYGNDTALAGFYANGEISPVNGNPGSRFHNQTMTITTFSERKDEEETPLK